MCWEVAGAAGEVEGDLVLGCGVLGPVGVDGGVAGDGGGEVVGGAGVGDPVGEGVAVTGGGGVGFGCGVTTDDDLLWIVARATGEIKVHRVFVLEFEGHDALHVLRTKTVEERVGVHELIFASECGSIPGDREFEFGGVPCCHAAEWHKLVDHWRTCGEPLELHVSHWVCVADRVLPELDSVGVSVLHVRQQHGEGALDELAEVVYRGVTEPEVPQVW